MRSSSQRLESSCLAAAVQSSCMQLSTAAAALREIFALCASARARRMCAHYMKSKSYVNKNKRTIGRRAVDLKRDSHCLCSRCCTRRTREINCGAATACCCVRARARLVYTKRQPALSGEARAPRRYPERLKRSTSCDIPLRERVKVTKLSPRLFSLTLRDHLSGSRSNMKPLITRGYYKYVSILYDRLAFLARAHGAACQPAPMCYREYRARRPQQRVELERTAAAAREHAEQKIKKEKGTTMRDRELEESESSTAHTSTAKRGIALVCRSAMGGVARRNHCATHSALLLLLWSERKKSIRRRTCISFIYRYTWIGCILRSMIRSRLDATSRSSRYRAIVDESSMRQINGCVSIADLHRGNAAQYGSAAPIPIMRSPRKRKSSTIVQRIDYPYVNYIRARADVSIGECSQRVPARRSDANVQRIQRGCSTDTIARTYNNPRHGHVREDRYKIKLMRAERDIISSVYSSALRTRIRLIDSSDCSEEDLVHAAAAVSAADFGARQHRQREQRRQQQQKRGRTKNNVYSSMPSRGTGAGPREKRIRRRRDILYETWNIRSAGSYAGLRLAAAYVYIVYNNCRAPAAGRRYSTMLYLRGREKASWARDVLSCASAARIMLDYAKGKHTTACISGLILHELLLYLFKACRELNALLTDVIEQQQQQQQLDEGANNRYAAIAASVRRHRAAVVRPVIALTSAALVRSVSFFIYTTYECACMYNSRAAIWSHFPQLLAIPFGHGVRISLCRCARLLRERIAACANYIEQIHKRGYNVSMWRAAPNVAIACATAARAARTTMSALQRRLALGSGNNKQQHSAANILMTNKTRRAIAAGDSVYARITILYDDRLVHRTLDIAMPRQLSVSERMHVAPRKNNGERSRETTKREQKAESLRTRTSCSHWRARNVRRAGHDELRCNACPQSLASAITRELQTARFSSSTFYHTDTNINFCIFQNLKEHCAANGLGAAGLLFYTPTQAILQCVMNAVHPSARQLSAQLSYMRNAARSQPDSTTFPDPTIGTELNDRTKREASDRLTSSRDPGTPLKSLINGSMKLEPTPITVAGAQAVEYPSESMSIANRIQKNSAYCTHIPKRFSMRHDIMCTTSLSGGGGAQ
ncbi:unnamed protein product [Trichogramma brassicae]|uniref:Uncharacterized protein n=1 Tax=Trichogramma brassicae TaxID=86971 RepID=A0A6H5IME9_9HYME|nr:unnamed protein product [Trichogramma brassicae]